MPCRSTLLHLLAGGCGGTAGAILTCPLEVVKTRLQSSSLALRPLCLPEVQLQGLSGGLVRPALPSPGVLQLMRAILEKEGIRSLFRGLGPNLVGVAPSRAIYFAAYAGAKEKLNVVFVPESKKVHMLSAVCAGVTSATLTNPIWLVKTRMQLEARAREEKHSNALQCAMRVYRMEGLRGFYRGISASYAGVSETVIHFVIYEALKQRLREQQPLHLHPTAVISVVSWQLLPSPRHVPLALHTHMRSSGHGCEKKGPAIAPLCRPCGWWSMKRDPWLCTEDSWPR